MPSIQDQYAEAIRTSQEAVVSAIEAWTQNVQKTFSQTPSVPAFPSGDAAQVIDQVFDFAEKMLEVQRDFAKNIASASASVGGALRQQAGATAEAAKEQTAAAAEASTRQAEALYEGLSRAELQEELTRRELPKSGNLEELRQRLRDDDARK